MGAATHPDTFKDGVTPAAKVELDYRYVRSCLQGALRRGFDPIALLSAAQIDAAAYSDPAARIDGEQLQRLILTIRNALNDEYLGFLDVQGKVEMSYMVGRAAVQSTTLGQALSRMARLTNAVRNDIHVEFDTAADEDTIALLFTSKGFVSGSERQLLSWLRMFWVYKFNCWLVGERIKLSEVAFSAPRSDDFLDYSVFLGCPIRFDAPKAGLFMPRRYLDAPIIRNDVELRERDFACGHTDWFSIPGRDQSFSSQVEQILVDLYKDGVSAINLDVLGDILCCSPRTLSRKLQKEDVTFHQIKVKVRQELAQKLLASTDMSIAKIAELVGFAEPADFTRAYVSWTGRTPSDYRAQRRPQKAA